MIDVDTTELVQLQKTLKEIGSPSVTDEVFGFALKEGSKVVHAYLEYNTPVSDEPSGVIPSNKGGDTTYARGGALLRSLRMRKSRFKKPEQLQVIVGFSKEKGFAGWRAHFTEYGAFNKAAGRFVPGQFFMRRVEQFTASQVEKTFERAAQNKIDKILR